MKPNQIQDYSTLYKSRKIETLFSIFFSSPGFVWVFRSKLFFYKLNSSRGTIFKRKSIFCFLKVFSKWLVQPPLIIRSWRVPFNLSSPCTTVLSSDLETHTGGSRIWEGPLLFIITLSQSRDVTWSSMSRSSISPVARAVARQVNSPASPSSTLVITRPSEVGRNRPPSGNS